MGLFKKGWLKKSAKKAVSLGNTLSPLGLIGKIKTKENILRPPSQNALRAGLGTGVKVGGALAGGALAGEAIGISTVLDSLSGSLSFGKDQNKAWVPVIIAVGAMLFLVFAFGGLFRKRKRR